MIICLILKNKNRLTHTALNIKDMYFSYFLALNAITLKQKHSFKKEKQQFFFVLNSSSPCRAGSTDIPDPHSPLFPIVHRLRQVF